MRVRIKESSFCVRTLRATLASLPDCGGKVDGGPCPSAASNCLATADLVSNGATVMTTGKTLDLRELRCRCNLECRFADANGNRSEDRDNFGASN